jgi:hypothetical protein
VFQHKRKQLQQKKAATKKSRDLNAEIQFYNKNK